MPDAEAIYEAMKDAAEQFGWVGEHADDLLDQAAQAIADDPQNEGEEPAETPYEQVLADLAAQAEGLAANDAEGIVRALALRHGWTVTDAEGERIA